MRLTRFAQIVAALCWILVVVAVTAKLAAVAQSPQRGTPHQVVAQTGQAAQGTTTSTSTTDTSKTIGTGTQNNAGGATSTTDGSPWWLTDTFLALVIWVSSLAAVGLGIFLYLRNQPVRSPEPREISDKDLEAYRITYGFWLIIAGLMLTLAVVIITVVVFRTGTHQFSDVIAVITSVTGVVGTLTAAFFGVQAAGAGRSQAISALSDQAKAQGGGVASTAFKIEPSVGPHSGNTSVSISGNGLTGATAVNFGTIPGLNFTAINDGLLNVTTPAIPLDKDQPDKTKSDYDLSVVFSSPAVNNRVVGTFYYYTMEIVNVGGKQDLNVYGTGLTGATAVQIGDDPPILIKKEDPGKVQVELPKPLFAVDVEVAIIYAPDSPNKRFVVGHLTFPPKAPTDEADGNGGGTTGNGNGEGDKTS